MYDIAARAALPSWEVFADRLSNSMMTRMGIMTVQWRLSMMEVSIDKEDKGMLVSTTSTIYPGTIERGVRLEQVWGRKEGGKKETGVLCLED